MSLLSIAEIFGYTMNDKSEAANDARNRKWCRFRHGPCNKQSLSDPLGICSFGTQLGAGAVCPNRFLEDDRIFADVGRTAFGSGSQIIVAPEIRILELVGKRRGKIGKVDFIIGKLDPPGAVVDFAALEVQAVYFSGTSIKPAFHHFLSTGTLPEDSKRRLDYRSSAQKRLMPQLNLKVPVFRRWGKKFFVAVDRLFFDNLPTIRSVPSLENSEVTWLIYPFAMHDTNFSIGHPDVQHTLWDDVLSALREGREPTPSEIMAELTSKKSLYRTLTT